MRIDDIIIQNRLNVWREIFPGYLNIHTLMEIQSENKDFVLARRICKELLSGNRVSLLEIYHKYHAFFSAFARQRLYYSSVNQYENVLTDYWIELLKSKAICGYEGKSSLRTYLTVILSRRIIDANRQMGSNLDH